MTTRAIQEITKVGASLIRIATAEKEVYIVKAYIVSITDCEIYVPPPAGGHAGQSKHVWGVHIVTTATGSAGVHEFLDMSATEAASIIF
jgi:hypothetical protein